MLVDIIRDEELQQIIKVFFSSLLPHENYKAEYFTQNLNILTSYVRLDEMKLEYYLLASTLFDLNKIKNSCVGYQPKLFKDTFTSILEMGIIEAVNRPEIGVKEWLAYEGLNSNLQVESTKIEVCQKLSNRALELYDECFNLAIDSENVINREPELKAAFISHVGMQSINTQIAIIQHGVKQKGKILNGFDDWIRTVASDVQEIKSRIATTSDERSVALDSIAKVRTFLEELEDLNVPIANYGIPPIDEFTPILKHRFVVVVGQENVGKTKFVIDKAVNILIEGAKVVFMCGETQKAKIFSDIMINFIYKKYNIIIRPEHLVGYEDPELCPDDVRKIICMSLDEIVMKDALILCDSFHYDTLYEELVELYEKHAFDVCVIDHSCALAGTYGDGSLKAKVDKLSDDVRIFRKQYPVCVMVTSHLSTTAKDAVIRDRSIESSPTKGSQNLSTDADEVFVLRDNEILRKQGLVSLENTKRRDASRLGDRVILSKRFEVSAFLYEESQQVVDADISLQTEEAIRALENENEDSDEYTL